MDTVDEHTAGVRHLMQDDADATGPQVMKKKKKRKATDDYVAVNSLMYKADPNEPVYCYCRQVSYGEMVGCDNPECSIEWFHFECVGLTASVSSSKSSVHSYYSCYSICNSSRKPSGIVLIAVLCFKNDRVWTHFQCFVNIANHI